jgi:2-polyprenyl-3-methyl-5-hydroxy-6-metoxy-1,4-benzoquinol methylase
VTVGSTPLADYQVLRGFCAQLQPVIALAYIHDAALPLAAGCVLDYGCGAGGKLLLQVQQDAPGAVLIGADPCLADTNSAQAEADLAVATTAAAADPCLADTISAPAEADSAVATATAAAAAAAEKTRLTAGADSYLAANTTAAAAAAAEAGGARGSLLLTRDCRWAAAGAGGLVAAAGGYDVVVCSLVLCVVAGRAEYAAVLDDLAAAVKPGELPGEGYVAHSNVSVVGAVTNVQTSASHECAATGNDL